MKIHNKHTVAVIGNYDIIKIVVMQYTVFIQ